MNPSTENRTELSSLTLPALTAYMKGLGEPAFRAKQLYGWLHQKQVTTLDAMTNLSLPLRQKLSETGYITEVSTVTRLTSKLDGTNKFLLGLSDGNCVEAVWMEYKHGASLCISTQVGCRQGCTFCASTLGGLLRNLTAGELLGQIYEVQRQMGSQISSLVLMGIGEPLDNFDNVMDFLTILSSPEGQNMSLRHVSLSTCGLVPEIRRLMEKNLGLTLSISLHASESDTRSNIMPINRKYDITELMSACKDYFAATGRRISYEYALIAGVNDSEQQALRLAALLRGQNCHVNLIPVNPVAERGTMRSGREAVERFAATLTKRGINATVRRELGGDINAACGQLRRNHKATADQPEKE
ncbi:MAG: 23S rRNA (adenine(2503)-C(2))-methyltransferase RlmN [Angelakisella sp.]